MLRLKLLRAKSLPLLDLTVQAKQLSEGRAKQMMRQHGVAAQASGARLKAVEAECAKKLQAQIATVASTLPRSGPSLTAQTFWP